MWLAGSELVDVYLGETAAAVMTAGESGETDAAHWLAATSVDEAWGLVAQHMAGTDGNRRPGRRVRLWLSGALARPFMFGPVAGLRRWAEANDVAASMASDATGLIGPCAIWLDDWRPDAPCLAVAMNRSLLDAIETSAAEHGLRIASIRPWWTAVLGAALQTPEAPRCLTIEDSDALVLLSGSELMFGTAVAYAPRPDAQQTEALLARGLLAAGIERTQASRASLSRNSASSDTVQVPFGVQWSRLA